MDFLKKGSRAFVEGRLETRSWEKDGQKHYATKVVIRPYNGQLILLDKPTALPPPSAATAVPSRGGSCDAAAANQSRHSVSNTRQRHVIEPGVFRANSFKSARVDHAAAFVVPWCMRVFKLAKSASGTSFAVIAALSAAFS